MKFCDLHLYASSRYLEHAERMIAKSSELGYFRVAVPLQPNVKEEVVHHLRQISQRRGLDFVTRLDLAPRNPGELLSDLRRFRRRFEVVSVLCGSKPVALQAAKDRRVDLLCFSSVSPRRRFFGFAEAELASGSSAALEVDVAQILSVNGSERVGLLASLRKEIAIASSHDVPLVISSGASNPLLLRKPHDCASLGLLFGVDSSLALKALSETPAQIVDKNRVKQSRGYVSPGVQIVKEGVKGD